MHIVLRNPLRMNAAVSKYAASAPTNSQRGVTLRNQLHSNAKYITLSGLASAFCKGFFEREGVENIRLAITNACYPLHDSDLTTTDIVLAVAFTSPSEQQRAQQEHQLLMHLFRYVQVCSND